MKTKQKRKNYCFACGPDNREGLRLRFRYDGKKKSVRCKLQLPARYQGATGYAHGGIIATLLDEAMAKVNGKEGIRAVTVKLQVSYLKMVPVGEQLDLLGWRTGKRGRKLFLRAELRGRRNILLATAKSLFIPVSSSS